MAYYLANQREIAIYEDGVFCPTLGTAYLERLARRPERFAIRVGRVAYIRPEQRPLIDAHTLRIMELLAGFDNQEIRLAILARLLQAED
jgi:hypothetical protein